MIPDKIKETVRMLPRNERIPFLRIYFNTFEYRRLKVGIAFRRFKKVLIKEIKDFIGWNKL